MSSRTPAVVAALVVVSMVGFVGVAAAAPVGGATGDAVAQADNQTATPTDNQTGGQATDGTIACDYEQLYDRTIDSVVLIRTTQGLGSGFVYEQANGTTYVITNEHVVGETSRVEVTFGQGDSQVGTVVGATALTDLAVVRLNETPEYVEVLPLAENVPDPGEYVAAIGSPYGLERTITSGIVSGVNRSMPTQQGFRIPNTVQTDAPINPGNSGGPLVRCEDGAVVGVNRAGGAENIGFAVSAPLVERIVPQLIENGTAEYPFLGVNTVPVTPSVAQANDLDTTEGVMIVGAVRESNASGVLQGADRAVVREDQRVPVGGDVVVAVDGMAVQTREDLVSYLLTETSPGESVELTVLRDGQRRTVDVTLGERPEPESA